MSQRPTTIQRRDNAHLTHEPFTNKGRINVWLLGKPRLLYTNQFVDIRGVIVRRTSHRHTTLTPSIIPRRAINPNGQPTASQRIIRATLTNHVTTHTMPLPLYAQTLETSRFLRNKSLYHIN